MSTSPLTLEDVMSRDDTELLSRISEKELTRLYWKFRGLAKTLERDTAFWSSTNENLKVAYEQLDEKERELAAAYHIIREDLEVAQSVQAALLPRMFATMASELELSVYHKQLTEVGGDYYDYFRTASDRYAIGVFDISGHGVSSALVMAYLKAQFMTIMERLEDPAEIVEWVNKASFEFLREVRKYATVNFVTFAEESLTYVCGGGYGLLLAASGEEYDLEKRNHFLGLRQKPYVETQLPFVVGDLLVLYTDGMVEAQNADGRDYTVARLNGLIRQNRALPTEEIVRLCVEDYQAFRSQDSDDITLLVARKTA
ncbi:MAG: SpoIIE family protein phosphatase [Myxococcales bacterium]|jgi:sigma-B regulation protein RsbU (phosphoserine phosphatase)|nr:SpoIIE family protein phosphatase [Myxococcales bacterium]HQY60862.1 SpoIIE family protein phosphatase [Polyangiaceae bacterium]